LFGVNKKVVGGCCDVKKYKQDLNFLLITSRAPPSASHHKHQTIQVLPQGRTFVLLIPGVEFGGFVMWE